MAFIKVCFLLLALAAGNDVDTCATSPEGCPASSDTEPTTLLQSRISVTGSSDALDAALADTDASPNAALANSSKKTCKEYTCPPGYKAKDQYPAGGVCDDEASCSFNCCNLEIKEVIVTYKYKVGDLKTNATTATTATTTTTTTTKAPEWGFPSGSSIAGCGSWWTPHNEAERKTCKDYGTMRTFHADNLLYGWWPSSSETPSWLGRNTRDVNRLWFVIDFGKQVFVEAVKVKPGWTAKDGCNAQYYHTAEYELLLADSYTGHASERSFAVASSGFSRVAHRSDAAGCTFVQDKIGRAGRFLMFHALAVPQGKLSAGITGFEVKTDAGQRSTSTCDSAADCSKSELHQCHCNQQCKAATDGATAAPTYVNLGKGDCAPATGRLTFLWMRDDLDGGCPEGRALCDGEQACTGYTCYPNGHRHQIYVYGTGLKQRPTPSGWHAYDEGGSGPLVRATGHLGASGRECFVKKA